MAKEYSKEAIEAFRRLTKKADFYAVAFKMGDSRDKQAKVYYNLYTGEGFWNLFQLSRRDENAEGLFRETKGTIRWEVRDLMRGKLKKVARAALFGEAVKTLEFQGVFEDVFPSDGNDRSRAQENKIAARLDAEMWHDTSWTAIGHTNMKKRTYTPDVISTEGLTIEVKGDSSDLRISFEDRAEMFAQA